MNAALPFQTILTTEHPASQWGCPVLVDERGHAYQPQERVPNRIGFINAAVLVEAWGRRLPLNAAGRELAAQYLAQWKEGPQL